MEEILAPLYPATFFAFLLLERFLTGRPQPKVRWWLVKGIVFFGIGGLINTFLPAILGKVVAGHTLLDLSSLGTVGGAIVGLAAASLLDYWLHRVMHRSHFLWRWSHQMHHSAERVDMAGFAYTHPFELMLATTIAPITSLALGVSPAGAAIAGFAYFTMGLFSHINANTPAWLGYIVQRPEMHCVHHTRGVHAYNYGLPIWDLAFGTFRNPQTVDAEFGFWDGASRQVGKLLVGRDVSAASSN